MFPLSCLANNSTSSPVLAVGRRGIEAALFRRRLGHHTAPSANHHSTAARSREWRPFASPYNQLRFHGSRAHIENPVKLKFVNRDKSVTEVAAELGSTVMEAAHENDIDLEGACEASLACSTCHVILEPGVFDRIPPATDREDDLLDSAPCLTTTSRLSCQVYVSRDLEGAQFALPENTLNFYVDGHIPKPH